jgi:hypothetical protein
MPGEGCRMSDSDDGNDDPLRKAQELLKRVKAAEGFFCLWEQVLVFVEQKENLPSDDQK